MQRMVTAVLIAGGMFVVLSRLYDEHTTQWAMGVITFVSGYWLRGAR